MKECIEKFLKGDNFLYEKCFYDRAFDIGYDNQYSCEMGGDYKEAEELEEEISSLVESAMNLLEIFEDRISSDEEYKEAEKLAREILSHACELGEAQGYLDS